MVKLVTPEPDLGLCYISPKKCVSLATLNGVKDIFIGGPTTACVALATQFTNRAIDGSNVDYVKLTTRHHSLLTG